MGRACPVHVSISSVPDGSAVGVTVGRPEGELQPDPNTNGATDCYRGGTPTNHHPHVAVSDACCTAHPIDYRNPNRRVPYTIQIELVTLNLLIAVSPKPVPLVPIFQSTATSKNYPSQKSTACRFARRTGEETSIRGRTGGQTNSVGDGTTHSLCASFRERLRPVVAFCPHRIFRCERLNLTFVDFR